MADSMEGTVIVPKTPTRVRVFIDYWNFQLSLNERAAGRFQVDWKRVGPILAERACAEVGIGRQDHVFDGVNVYTSYNPRSPESRKYFNWVTTWLDRQAGVQVDCRERRPKHPPTCPSCYREISDCPHCNERMVGSIEKGVDTLLATDMIRLAWEQAYDIAVLATSDADLVPAVDFLNTRARKVIQAGFPPKGLDLATACWASFDVWSHRDDLRRDF